MGRKIPRARGQKWKVRKAEVSVLWNNFISLDDDGQQKAAVGTVNNTHRKRWWAGYHVMVPGTLPVKQGEGEVWWKGRGPTDKQSKGVMHMRASYVALRRWIMSQAACKLWSENNKSCWLTVVVEKWGRPVIWALACTGRPPKHAPLLWAKAEPWI